MMIRGFTLIAAMLCCTTAIAADRRIQTLTYDSGKIVQIVGREGIQSTVEFGPDEHIENVAIGDSSVWQVTPNRRGSLLFLKPLARTTRTNMTVVTDRHLYMFDLVASPAAGEPVYVLKFDFPNEKRPVAAPAAQVAQASVPQPVAPEHLNFGWQTKGSGRLLPSRIFDDGRALYLAWNPEMALPAILTVSSEGREGPVNYRTSGNFIVVDPLPSNIVLRQGKRIATIMPGRALNPSVAPRAPSRAAPTRAVQQAQARPSGAVALGAIDINALYGDNLTGGNGGQ
jgi:type IV secretion system protein VirB9